MSSDDGSRFKLSADDLRNYNWQDLLAAHPDKQCRTYYQVFGRASARYRESGDHLGERVFAFLNVIASFSTNFDSEDHPYRPVLRESDGRRSLMPDDLTDPDLDVLQSIVNDIDDPEFRARVADIIWVCPGVSG